MRCIKSERVFEGGDSKTKAYIQNIWRKSTIQCTARYQLEYRKRGICWHYGPSGSGKTTLLNVISTIDPPTSGEVLINGENPYKLDNSKLAI